MLRAWAHFICKMGGYNPTYLLGFSWNVLEKSWNSVPDTEKAFNECEPFMLYSIITDMKYQWHIVDKIIINIICDAGDDMMMTMMTKSFPKCLPCACQSTKCLMWIILVNPQGNYWDYYYLLLMNEDTEA